MAKYCVIKENDRVRVLLSIIESSYESKSMEADIYEVDLNAVLEFIRNKDIRILVSNTWHDIEMLVGHQIMLLINNAKRNIIRRLMNESNFSLTIKVRKDSSSQDVFQSIYKASNFRVELREMSSS